MEIKLDETLWAVKAGISSELNCEMLRLQGLAEKNGKLWVLTEKGRRILEGSQRASA